MTVTVHSSPPPATWPGPTHFAVELPPRATVADLRAELARRRSRSRGLLAKSAVAVNHDFAEDERVLSQPTKSPSSPP